jgi:hypothetical protein
MMGLLSVQASSPWLLSQQNIRDHRKTQFPLVVCREVTFAKEVNWRVMQAFAFPVTDCHGWWFFLATDCFVWWFSSNGLSRLVVFPATDCHV